MRTYELIAPCHFGLEAVLKREIYDLGYEITRVEDGRVSFTGDAEAVCRANLFLRTAERVLIEVGRFYAGTFDELFEGVRALPWEDYLPKNARFWVKSILGQEPAFQPFGYPVHRKKSGGGALEGAFFSGVVCRGRGGLSAAGLSHEG